MLDYTHTEVFEVVFGIVSLLMFGNIFFIKKLVHEIEKIGPLSDSFTRLSNKVDEIAKEMSHVTDLRIEIAMLKTKLTKYASNGNGEFHDDDHY